MSVNFSYREVNRQDGGTNNNNDNQSRNEIEAKRTLYNFVLMSILFSANHGCVVSCLSLATAQLGSIGAWQSGILYITYTGSALVGATYIVKKIGSRDALLAGMALYCAYVACFLLATIFKDYERVAAYIGAAIGGIGAGFLWTAQGAYFAQAAEQHSQFLQQPLSTSTSTLASIFAFLYLAEEVGLRLLSTFMLEISQVSWNVIFGIYTAVTIASTVAMFLVHKYPSSEDTTNDNISVWYKVTAAWQVLKNDPKMKYMIGLNAVFGLAAAFLNSYVNGEVVSVVLKDSKYIGALSAWVSGVAAAMSLVFGKVSEYTGNKGPILYLGAICFMNVALPFILFPNIQSQWNGTLLIGIYTLQGIGRATFEGTLKATFADYFVQDKEGAFANIILQNGLAGAIGYIMTFSLQCDKQSTYCVPYLSDGNNLHDVLSFELSVVIAGIVAILGYWRATQLFAQQQQTTLSSTQTEEENLVENNSNGVSA